VREQAHNVRVRELRRQRRLDGLACAHVISSP